VDKVLSKDSTGLVEAHLAQCENCTQKLHALQTETAVKDYDGVHPMKKFKSRFLRHKILTGVTVGVCAAILLGLFLCFFEYTYSYDQLENDVKVISDSDGHVHIVYNGDKLLFSKYRLDVIGVKDGKAQCRLSLYESVNFRDLWYYYCVPATVDRQLHNDGKPFEWFTVCPNDKDFGWWCDTCMADTRFVSNCSTGRDGGLGMRLLYNFDKPNPYSESEWEQLGSVNKDTMPWNAYEELEVEICRVEYCRFNAASPWENQKSHEIWTRADIPCTVKGTKTKDR
jgi:hypothetical protein